MDLWDECGGISSWGHDSADKGRCCKDGNTCARVNQYYWQCQPQGGQESGEQGAGSSCKQVGGAIAAAWQVVNQGMCTT